MSFAWVNGEFVDDASASVSIRDTGLLHAAGVFTTMRASAGGVFRMPAHLTRLRGSCDAFAFPLPYTDDELIATASELLERNSLTDARLRLTATRGFTRQDEQHGLVAFPQVFMTAGPIETYPAEWYERGMTVTLIDEQKLNPYDVQAGHKTLNYFSRLNALRDATRKSAGEALWFNVHNYLQSACVANVFIVKSGTLYTPPTQADLLDDTIRASVPYPRSNVLPGITRATVLDLAERHDIPVQCTAIDIHQLLDADEIFLTNSIMGVMPVTRIEQKTIGAEKPGEITRMLSDRYPEVHTADDDAR